MFLTYCDFKMVTTSPVSIMFTDCPFLYRLFVFFKFNTPLPIPYLVYHKIPKLISYLWDIYAHMERKNRSSFQKQIYCVMLL
jgi:hypothetical protein